MVEVTGGLFTVGVFQDVAWAEKGLKALQASGFPLGAVSFIAKDSPDVTALAERTFGRSVGTMEIHAVGTARANGPIVDALQGSDESLTKHGIAASAKRIGFQAHDGRIFERLTGRGGVLVAVSSDSRASDALALMFSYGGGNAAIGAWSGRL